MENFQDYYLMNEGRFGQLLGAATLAGSLLGGSPTLYGNTLTNSHNISNQDFTKKAEQYVIQHEGIRNKVYKDTKGLLHIGIGHKLVNSDKALFIKEFNGTIDYNKICNGTQKLNLSQIYKLFSIDLNRGLIILNKKYPKFNNFPEEVKLALLDGAFRGEEHPKVDQLINHSQWANAAVEYLNNKEYKHAVETNSGVATRMYTNANLIASAAKKQ